MQEKVRVETHYHEDFRDDVLNKFITNKHPDRSATSSTSVYDHLTAFALKTFGP